MINKQLRVGKTYKLSAILLFFELCNKVLQNVFIPKISQFSVWLIVFKFQKIGNNKSL